MTSGCAGLLLTGGASRRLGVDKAELVLAGEPLADRAARVLLGVCDPVLEVGPGRSALDAVREDPPGSGPLRALVSGAAELRAGGHSGPVVLLAVDLPFVEAPLLQALVDWPDDRTVVPRAAGEPQSCCARYGPAALETATTLVDRGERSLRSLLAATPVDEMTEQVWRAVAPPHAFEDLDTPEDLARFGLRPRR